MFKYIELPSVTTSMENSNEYSIFAAALKLTGLADSLLNTERDKTYVMGYHSDRDGNLLYYPKHCEIGYTVFAEKDVVFQNVGINSLEDLVAKCREWYGNPTWYDLLAEQGIKVSTGTDYTNEWNVLHMFMAYHIVRARIAVDELVYEKNSRTDWTWNYCFGYEPQAYYETMLPGTLLKVWQTNPKTNKELWINRYVKNNTLTNQYGTFGSDSMHPIVYTGAQIDRETSIETLNAYVHNIDKVMLYNSNARNAQHERMRFHVNQMLPELATNKIMRATPSDVSSLNGGGDGNRIAFATDFFDNLQCYVDDMVLRYNVMGAWRALESTQFQGWGAFDFAIRLPRVPSGKYEVRYMYPPMYRGGEIDFYIGNSRDKTTMTKMSILDVTKNPYESSEMGYVQINPEEGEYGIESGKVMRQKGYMYAPASFSRGTYNVITDKLNYSDDDPFSACKQMVGYTSCRTESGYGTMMLRYIVGTVDMQQSKDYWLRFKGVCPSDFPEENLGWALNFIELVPTDVADNDTYMEDWY